jgi:plastocyanin
MNKLPYLCLALLTALALAGCSSKSSDEYTVTIKDFKFSPDSITIEHGEKITFRNADSATHTATSDTAGAFDTGNIAAGSDAVVTFATAGTFTYHCAIHSNMAHATVIVT